MHQTSIPVLHAARFAGEDEPTLFQMIRRQQCVPGVLLARREAEEILSLDPAEVDQAMQTDEHPVVRLEMGSHTEWARVAEIARDPYGKTIWHVEMTRLPVGEVVAVDVPLRILLKSAQRQNTELTVEHLQCVRIEGPVQSLPEFLNIDARRLRAPATITVGDLQMPNCCVPVDVSPETPVVSVERAPKRKTRKSTN